MRHDTQLRHIVGLLRQASHLVGDCVIAGTPDKTTGKDFSVAAARLQDFLDASIEDKVAELLQSEADTQSRVVEALHMDWAPIGMNGDHRLLNVRMTAKVTR